MLAAHPRLPSLPHRSRVTIPCIFVIGYAVFNFYFLVQGQPSLDAAFFGPCFGGEQPGLRPLLAQWWQALPRRLRARANAPANAPANARVADAPPERFAAEPLAAGAEV